MKKVLKYYVVSILFGCAFFMQAENRWNVAIGGNISHKNINTYWGTTSDWGGGAFLNAGYEINFNSHWSLNPQIEFDYINNGAYVKSYLPDSKYYDDWREAWNVNLPVICSFRFPLSDWIKLRVGVGPRFQESIAGRKYNLDLNKKVAWHDGVLHRFNIGIQGEIAVETGNGLSYLFRMAYPFARENWMGETFTLSVGIRYSF